MVFSFLGEFLTMCESFIIFVSVFYMLVVKGLKKIKALPAPYAYVGASTNKGILVNA